MPVATQVGYGVTNAFTRRAFLQAGARAGLVAIATGNIGVAAMAVTLRPDRAGAQCVARPGNHPDPRPGIDASNVLTAAELADAPHAVPLFDAVREIPHIVDGLLCYCGCAAYAGYRSLLTCYEGTGMAKYCDICQAH